MQYLLDGSQMKAVDRYHIETLGIPSLSLMERAAQAAASEAERLLPGGGKVLVLCGAGNNGADGLAAARMLSFHGYTVRAVLFGDPARATEEWKVQFGILKKLGVPADTADGLSEYGIEEADLILDALFGIGLRRPLEGAFYEAVLAVNRAACPVVSVDIPSGIDAGTGQILGAAVKASVTVTFGYEKLGMVLYPGAAYCGKRVLADIGFTSPPWLTDTGTVRAFLPGEPGILPERRSDGNKGTFGKVLIAAGSPGMCGAAYMSALSAYRTGAGLVRIYTAKENVPVLQTLLPEAVVTSYDSRRIEEAEPEKALDWADVLVVGPGLSTEPYAKVLLTRLLQARRGKPAVLDADALNLLAADGELLSFLDDRCIVTPHIGEMARLTGKTAGELKAGPVEAAKEFQEAHGAVCVLKDARTVVASEKGIYVNLSGNDGMATGGSGDVLSGILGGLLAGGLAPSQAAETGVWLHGLSGDLAADRLGRRAMTAADLAGALGDILKNWE